MLARQIAKFAAAVLVALTLTLSFAPATHAQTTAFVGHIYLVVDGQVTTYSTLAGNIERDRQVTLTRLYAHDPIMRNWIEQARTGSQQAIKDVHLILYDQYNYPVARYRLIGAFPVQYAIASLAAGSGSLFERVTLAYDYAYSW